MKIPKGFSFGVAEAAIKKPGRPDMAVIFSEKEAAIAGVFTTNRIKGAPVKLDIERIKKGRAGAIVVNSGNANVCNGQKGIRDAREMARIAALGLGIDEETVYVASTGVIGTPMPMERIKPVLAAMAKGSGALVSGFEDVARAMMTTDTFPKYAARSFKLDGREVRIAAVAKGSGMIHPNMATMLCFIITDIGIGKAALNRALRDSVDKSFNRITVDGDTSTSDTVLLMANGLAGNPPVKISSGGYAQFSRALDDITTELARMVARDGEGATKLIEVHVKGAKTKKDALSGAFTIADSPLVKTAFFGNDANWGRIMAALGRSGISIEEEKVDIYMGKIKIVGGGKSKGKDAEAGRLLKASKEISLVVDLNLGVWSEKVLTCDLTDEYVRINAEYRT
ncbi:MAG: bifunctional glutamate N-acetyltransferase/amino-acid acetyltransferase ArgJ [Nitrospiraceae bacterium]|nr:bifunctional glutamate N-acetyltransferase/amino-acid acetyltransferase ArgJ [Nitrospiraceae bacterium]